MNKNLKNIKTYVTILFVSVFCLLISVFCSPSYATVPHLINYQGRLTDSGGTPLDGSYSLTFRIYDAEAAGNLLWEENQAGVVIQKGIFSILLGSVANLNLAFDKPYFLEIKVGSEVMSPRQAITSAGYAIRAERLVDEPLPAARGGTGSTANANAANGVVVLDASSKLPAGVQNIAILTGTVANGGTIPLPDGYSQAQCKWMVSPISPRTTTETHEVDYFGFNCYADANRVVTSFYRTRGSGNISCDASYMIIGIK